MKKMQTIILPDEWMNESINHQSTINDMVSSSLVVPFSKIAAEHSLINAKTTERWACVKKKPVDKNHWSSKLHITDIEARYDSDRIKISQMGIQTSLCEKPCCK